MAPESQMGGQYSDPDLWAVDKLKSKMGINMAISEALIDEHPLRTENTPDDTI